MASFNRVVMGGSTNLLSVPFPYLDRSHVKVYLDGVLRASNTYSWVTSGQISLDGGNPSAGTVAETRRETPSGPITTFVSGNLDVTDLNAASLQPLYLAEEAYSLASDLMARGWVTAGLGAGGTITKGASELLAGFDSAGNIIPRTVPEVFDLNFATVAQGARADLAYDYYVSHDPRWYGYVADGLSHPLSGVMWCQGFVTMGWSLLQWKTLFPKATALTNEVAGLAIQRFWDVRPKGGTFVVPDATGEAYSTNHIDTGGLQDVSYVSFNRGMTELVFVNDIESAINGDGDGFGICHGRLVAASGTFRQEGFTVKCHSRRVLGGTFVQAHYFRFDTTLITAKHKFIPCIVRDCAYFGADFTTTGGRKADYWPTVAGVYDFVRGVVFEDCFIWGALFYDSDTPTFKFGGTQANAASNSVELRNCIVYGHSYFYELDFSKAGGTANQTIEEVQCWNCQIYLCRAGLANLDNSGTAVYTDNYTFHDCQCATIQGPIFRARRVQTIKSTKGLYGNTAAITNGGALVADISDCVDVTFSEPSIYITKLGAVVNPAQNMKLFKVAGASYKVHINEVDITAFDNYGVYLEVAAGVPAGQVLETGLRVTGTQAPLTSYVNDLSGVQHSEMRLKEKVAAAKVANPSLYSNLQVSMDLQGNVNFHALVDCVTASGSGDFQYTWPPGLFRSIPADVDVKAGTISAQNQDMVWNAPTSSVVLMFFVGSGAGVSRKARINVWAVGGG